MKYIIGAGNYSMFDDSIGIRIIEHIVEKNLEKNFTAVELSGNALNLLSYLNEETEKIVIIDTVRMGAEPGGYKFFMPESVVSEKELAGFSTHEGDMIKVIELGRRTGHHIPKIIIMGIEPEEMKMEFGLSNTLQNKIDLYTDKAMEKINE